MKKKLIISGLAVLSVLAITAAASSVLAADSSVDSSADSQSTKVRMHRNMPELTDAQKAEMEAKMAEQKTKMEAVETALTNGDYNAWILAQKAINENCPMLEKITADNFSKYVEANNLRKQADNIMKDLGIGEGREGMGLGGFGGLNGGHGRMMGEKPVNAK